MGDAANCSRAGSTTKYWMGDSFMYRQSIVVPEDGRKSDDAFYIRIAQECDNIAMVRMDDEDTSSASIRVRAAQSYIHGHECSYAF